MLDKEKHVEASRTRQRLFERRIQIDGVYEAANSSSISDSSDASETSSPCSACFSERALRQALWKKGSKNVSIDGATILGAHLVGEHLEISRTLIPNVLCTTDMSARLAHEIRQ